jgi:hypothetical protein
MSNRISGSPFLEYPNQHDACHCGSLPKCLEIRPSIDLLARVDDRPRRFVSPRAHRRHAATPALALALALARSVGQSPRTMVCFMLLPGRVAFAPLEACALFYRSSPRGVLIAAIAATSPG